MIFRGGSMAVTLVTDDALHTDRVRRVADGPAADRREIATPTELVDLIGRTGYSRFRLSRLLDRLATHYLAGTDRRDRWQLRGRTHTSGTKLGRAARTLDVLGLLTARARRYTIERAAWAWWTDELAWRRAPAAVKQRTPGAGQLELPTAGGRDHLGRYPVDHRGRADYAAALTHFDQAGGGRRQAS